MYIYLQLGIKQCIHLILVICQYIYWNSEIRTHEK